MSSKKKLGIISSRGLGDIIIALPIAHYYHKQGYKIYWPIADEFISNVAESAPWVNWIPVPIDESGEFFYNEPIKRLKNFKVTEVICLYQSLTGHPELIDRPEFQITKFDQIKYHEARVPFLEKWKLSECITRIPHREQALRDRAGIQPGIPYVVIHAEGSTHTAAIDPDWIPSGWQTIFIEPMTDSVFDWLGILESADAIITVDSVFANLVDQLGINNQVESYFIPRSHIHLTPVLGGPWTVLDPGPEVMKRIQLFTST